MLRCLKSERQQFDMFSRISIAQATLYYGEVTVCYGDTSEIQSGEEAFWTSTNGSHRKIWWAVTVGYGEQRDDVHRGVVLD